MLQEECRWTHSGNQEFIEQLHRGSNASTVDRQLFVISWRFVLPRVLPAVSSHARDQGGRVAISIHRRYMNAHARALLQRSTSIPCAYVARIIGANASRKFDAGNSFGE